MPVNFAIDQNFRPYSTTARGRARPPGGEYPPGWLSGSLVVWVEEPGRQRTLLLDGHDRFEICTRHHLPFTTVAITLPDSVAAADWIDANQLGGAT